MARQKLATRIKRALRGLSNRVAKFEEEGFKLPSFIYRMLNADSVSSARLDRIQSYDDRKLKSLAKFKTDSGEVIDYDEYSRRKRSESAKKGWATRRRRRLEYSTDSIVRGLSAEIIRIRLSGGVNAGTLQAKENIADYLSKLLSDAVKTANRDGELEDLYNYYVQNYSVMQDALDAIAGQHYIGQSNYKAVSMYFGRVISILGKPLGIDSDEAYDYAEATII